MTQGQGDGTYRKQELFFHANMLGMRIKNAKLAGYPFWLFDGNCGSGWNSEVDVIGSPINAHLAADNAGLPVDRRRFFFCDRDERAMRELQERLAQKPEWANCSYLLPGDNEGALDVFAQCIRDRENPVFAVGVIVIDPNGYFYRRRDGFGPPIDGLSRFTQQFKRIDVILNLDKRAYALQRGKGQSVLPPDQVLASLHKRHWLVGRIRQGNSRRLIAIGRNVETADHRRVGLVHLNSEEGREVMLWAEGRRQSELLDE